MNSADHSFDDPASNLALDEVLLRGAISGEWGESLRFWESPSYFVVLGLTQKVSSEVNVDRCEADGVPILRRCSAGGCVVQGPGCLNYTLVLSGSQRPLISTIHGSYEYILGRIVEGLRVDGLHRAGISDLAIGDLKVSGNAQRRHKDFILHHGTLLYDADIGVISRYIQEPNERPEYRGGRKHAAFVANLDISRSRLMEAISIGFGADLDTASALPNVVLERVERLAEEKYRLKSWNYRK